MRLIDADLLIEWIDAGHLRNPNELCFSEADVVEMIDHMPTAEERKTGKWKPDRDNECDWYCSECDYLGNRWFKYCPNCGSYNGGET